MSKRDGEVARTAPLFVSCSGLGAKALGRKEDACKSHARSLVNVRILGKSGRTMHPSIESTFEYMSDGISFGSLPYSNRSVDRELTLSPT